MRAHTHSLTQPMDAHVCLQWQPSDELRDPKDANLIDVENDPYLSRPQEFEPGYGQPPDAHNPHASAPLPTDSLLNFGFPGVYFWDTQPHNAF